VVLPVSVPRTQRGTKVSALTGKINNTGLVEVPMGITLREILYDIGGGVPGGKRFKAVQTGGPSGGTLIVETAEPKIHASMVAHVICVMRTRPSACWICRSTSMIDSSRIDDGSGGMIVMDEDSCMVDVARYFLNFLVEESCGKCVPCREGIVVMLNILKKVCEGKGTTEDIEYLEELSQ